MEKDEEKMERGKKILYWLLIAICSGCVFAVIHFGGKAGADTAFDERDEAAEKQLEAEERRIKEEESVESNPKKSESGTEMDNSEGISDKIYQSLFGDMDGDGTKEYEQVPEEYRDMV